MEKIKLYIDEDLSDRIAVTLRSKGFDVISAHEIEMRGKSDREQMEYAIKHKRVFLTRNVKHFVHMQNEYHKCGLTHSGIVVTNYIPLKEMIRRLTNFLNNVRPSDMTNRLDWLQNYK